MAFTVVLTRRAVENGFLQEKLQNFSKGNEQIVLPLRHVLM